MKERPVQSARSGLALATIIAHVAVAALHGAAHQILGVELSANQLLFIVTVIMLTPLVAGLLLWKKMRTTGALLLACSMAGSLIFGIYNHFVAISPDHVSHVGALPQDSGHSFFRLPRTLAFVEALGFGPEYGR